MQNLDDNNTQIQLQQGSLYLHVLGTESSQHYEIDTPNLAFSVTSPGEYRIDVNDAVTTITVRNGAGEASGDNATYPMDVAGTCQFNGTDINDPQCSQVAPLDDFDRWNKERDQLAEKNISTQYVANTLIGHEDLDNSGTWQQLPEYGEVWTPDDVDESWAPYHSGYWLWVRVWGWTWVDNAPWGFATSHYGRWAYIHGRWYWVPGEKGMSPI